MSDKKKFNLVLGPNTDEVNHFRDIAYGKDGRFVTVGDTGTIWMTKPNNNPLLRDSWYETSIPTNHLYTVHYSEHTNTWISAGNANSIVKFENNKWEIINGVNGFTGAWFSSCYHNNKNYLGANDGTLAVSSDGINWKKIQGPGGYIKDMCSTPIGILCANINGTINIYNETTSSLKSIQVDKNTSPVNFQAVCYTGKYYFVGGGANKISRLYRSTDAINWVEIPFSNMPYIMEFQYTNGVLFATGNADVINPATGQNEAFIAYSKDNGITWIWPDNDYVGTELGFAFSSEYGMSVGTRGTILGIKLSDIIENIEIPEEPGEPENPTPSEKTYIIYNNSTKIGTISLNSEFKIV